MLVHNKNPCSDSWWDVFWAVVKELLLPNAIFALLPIMPEDACAEEW